MHSKQTLISTIKSVNHLILLHVLESSYEIQNVKTVCFVCWFVSMCILISSHITKDALINEHQLFTQQPGKFLWWLNFSWSRGILHSLYIKWPLFWVTGKNFLIKFVRHKTYIGLLQDKTLCIITKVLLRLFIMTITIV